MDMDPVDRYPDDWRIHPLIKRAAVFGFVLGFAGAVLVQQLRQPHPANLAQNPPTLPAAAAR